MANRGPGGRCPSWNARRAAGLVCSVLFQKDQTLSRAFSGFLGRSAGSAAESRSFLTKCLSLAVLSKDPYANVPSLTRRSRIRTLPTNGWRHVSVTITSVPVCHGNIDAAIEAAAVRRRSSFHPAFARRLSCSALVMGARLVSQLATPQQVEAVCSIPARCHFPEPIGDRRDAKCGSVLRATFC